MLAHCLCDQETLVNQPSNEVNLDLNFDNDPQRPWPGHFQYGNIMFNFVSLVCTKKKKQLTCIPFSLTLATITNDLDLANFNMEICATFVPKNKTRKLISLLQSCF